MPEQSSRKRDMNASADIPLGIVHGMPIRDYHSGPGISNSGLRDIAQSPLHFHARHLNPLRPQPIEKAGQLEGNLAHCAILEPDQFTHRYEVGPCNDKRLTAWKAWEALPRAQGITCIKPTQHDVAKAQAYFVRQMADVGELLATGHPEVSAYWIDQSTGELCRCRPDWVSPVGDDGAVILVDVKTYSDASPGEFSRQIARMGYHQQAAFYSDGYAQASGAPVLGFVFVAVEDSWPFAACACMLDDESLEAGRRQYRANLDRYAACRRDDVWPSYSDSIELVSLPHWALAA